MNEQGQMPSKDKVYTEDDMLEAYRQGRRYKTYISSCDLDYSSLPELHRPFYEWLRLKKGNG